MCSERSFKKIYTWGCSIIITFTCMTPLIATSLDSVTIYCICSQPAIMGDSNMVHFLSFHEFAATLSLFPVPMPRFDFLLCKWSVYWGSHYKSCSGYAQWFVVEGQAGLSGTCLLFTASFHLGCITVKWVNTKREYLMIFMRAVLTTTIEQCQVRA